jgi:hypothetical protein
MQKLVTRNVRINWGISTTHITIPLQTMEVHRNRNAPCDYTYTGSSGKQEVTVELS